MAPHWKCGSRQRVAGSNPALSATYHAASTRRALADSEASLRTHQSWLLALDAGRARIRNPDQDGAAVNVIRRVGIAFGSLVAAWLCVWLVGGWLIGPSMASPVATIIAVVIGAFVYRDIVRRDSSSP